MVDRWVGGCVCVLGGGGAQSSDCHKAACAGQRMLCCVSLPQLCHLGQLVCSRSALCPTGVRSQLFPLTRVHACAPSCSLAGLPAVAGGTPGPGGGTPAGLLNSPLGPSPMMPATGLMPGALRRAALRWCMLHQLAAGSGRERHGNQHPFGNLQQPPVLLQQGAASLHMLLQQGHP